MKSNSLPSNDWDNERPRYVRQLFRRIARRYNLVNCVMTAGQDRVWRQEVIQLACLKPGDLLLDIGTGTGALAFEAQHQQPCAQIVAADFTVEMMEIGRQRGVLHWLATDALYLPFDEGTFDVVVSGFLMRNVREVQAALHEQYRVLKPGGRIIILETTCPSRNIFSPWIWVYFRLVIPFLGGLMTGEFEAYKYLYDSTTTFLTAEQLAEEMENIGFREIAYQRKMFGVIAIHRGEK